MSLDAGVSACLRVALGGLVAACVAAIGVPAASADTSATVQVENHSDAGPTVRQDGIYQPGDALTPMCADLSHHAAPQCSSPPAGVSRQPAPVADSGRTTGRTQGVNPGAPGQCTWGAAQKWFDASGSYPATQGNAMAWADSAAAAGWTVVDDARERSIVVFQPGVAGAGGIGHVAWVDSVSQRPDGRWIHVTEMNNISLGGPGIFNGRDVKEVPGMSYVLLP